MITLLHGENVYESTRALSALLGNNATIVDASELDDLSVLASKNEALSFFDAGGPLVLKRLLANKKKTLVESLLDYLNSHKQLANDLIFWEPQKIDQRSKFSNWVKKYATVKEFTFPNPARLVMWLRETAHELGFALPPSFAEKIIGLAGTDQQLLENELHKLQLLLESEKRKDLQEGDLELVSNNTREEDVWALTDALSARDRKLALQLVNDLYSQFNDFPFIISILTRQLKILYLLKQPLDRRELIAKLKIHPYTLSKASRESYKFDERLIKLLFNKLAHLDFAIKEGKIEPRLGLNLLLASI